MTDKTAVCLLLKERHTNIEAQKCNQKPEKRERNKFCSKNPYTNIESKTSRRDLVPLSFTHAHVSHSLIHPLPRPLSLNLT